MSDGGKGDNRRPGDDAAFASNFDRIFDGGIKRGAWVFVNGQMVPKDEYHAPAPETHMVMTDIQPYQSMATGELVGGRAQNREHLKRNGLIEVGNETKYLKNEPKREPAAVLKRRIAEIVNDRLR